MSGVERRTKPSEEAGLLRQPFENLLADGRRRLGQVEEALREIDLKYRGRSEQRSYRQFLTALRLANEAATQALADAESDFEVTPRPAYDKAWSLMKGMSEKHEKQVEALRAARAEPLEVFSQPFTRLAKRLVPNSEVLFFGWKLEGYELRVFHEGFASKFTPAAGVSTRREFGSEFQFLQFWHPVLRQTDLFQHAAFGHELAHAVILRPPPEEVLAALQVEPSASASYATVAVDYAHREAPAAGADTDEKKKRLAQWFDEIACDIVGMRLLGPAFGLAFAEVTSVNWDLERKDLPDRKRYPPTKLRLRYLREEIGRFTFPPSRDQQLRQALEQAIASEVDEGDPEEIEGATDWMKAAVGAFRNRCVVPLLQGQELRQEELEANYLDISCLIADGVPPAERLMVTDDPPPGEEGPGPWSREYDWRLILNVSRIGLLDREGEGWDLERPHACQMATGAIEMAEFQRRARKLREQYRVVGRIED